MGMENWREESKLTQSEPKGWDIKYIPTLQKYNIL